MKLWREGRKRLVVVVAVAVAVIALVLGSWGGALADQTNKPVGGDVWCLTFTWTAAGGGGAYTAETSRDDIVGWVMRVETDPGATAPTDNYDITLKNTRTLDISGGNLANRDTANTETVMPKPGANDGAFFNDSTLVHAITGNSVANAVGVTKVFYLRSR